MIRVAIVEDDDKEASNLEGFLKRYGNEYDESFVICRFSNGADFIDHYKAEYDIIFMDIIMPYMNGITAAKRLRVLDEETILIFTTNMAQYAINGYEVGAMDYLLKPLNYSSFIFRLQNALKRVKKKAIVELLLTTKEGTIKLDLNDLCYVEVQKHRLIYHTVKGEYVEWRSLKEAEEKITQLLPGQFSRCNNSFLVNLRYITKVEKDDLYVDKDVLKISRSHMKTFMDDLTLFSERGI